MSHPTVKHFLRLQQDRPYRHQQQSTVIDGRRMVQELSWFGAIRIKHLLCLPADLEAGTVPLPGADRVSLVTPEVMAHVGMCKGLRQVAEVAIPPTGNRRMRHVVAMLGLRYPANVGNILRTALGLGWDGAFMGDRDMDPFSSKVVRASRGACLRLPIRTGDLASLGALAQELGDGAGAPPRPGGGPPARWRGARTWGART